MILAIPFIRLWRWFNWRCLVCGKGPMRPSIYGGRIVHLRYCSMECAAYDKALRNQKKSWILFGTVTGPKRHHEYLEHDENDCKDSGHSDSSTP